MSEYQCFREGSDGTQPCSLEPLLPNPYQAHAICTAAVLDDMGVGCARPATPAALAPQLRRYRAATHRRPGWLARRARSRPRLGALIHCRCAGGVVVQRSGAARAPRGRLMVCNGLMGMENVGALWSTYFIQLSANHGRIRHRVRPNLGRSRPSLSPSLVHSWADSDRTRSMLTKIWSTPAEFGRLRPDVAAFGQIWPPSVKFSRV